MSEVAFEEDLYKKMLETSHSAGIPMLTDDFCCRLLAWLYHYGGGYEAVIINKKMHADIMHAQKRLNVYGGESVKPELFPLLKQYLREVVAVEKPQWVLDIMKKYNLK